MSRSIVNERQSFRANSSASDALRADALRRASRSIPRACSEVLETRRLLHAALQPDGDLDMFDINGATGDTFVVNYIAATDSIQMIHNGSPSHPGNLTPRSSITGEIHIKTDATGGDDVVTINGTGGINVVLDLGGGNDTVIVNGTNSTPAKHALVDMFGGAGNDTMFANASDDTSAFMNGDAGNDTYNVADTYNGIGFFFGDADNDTYNGGNGDSFTEADGGPGNDTLNGGSDAETLDGDAGDDLITGGGGTDKIDGGADNDVIKTFSDGSIDTVNGGTGTDTAYIDYFDVINPVGSVENVYATDVFEPNDSFAAASDLGVLGDRTITGLTLHQASDGDYFKFVAETSGMLSVNVAKNDPTAGTMRVDVYDSSLNKVNDNSTAASRTVSVVGGSTYYLAIGSVAGSPTKDYTLNVDGPNLPAPSFVSDLTPTFSTNGWGFFEKDKSNGETGAHDGHTITLNGVTYAKGLGVVPASDLRYNLAGKYTTFTADIGVDDEVSYAGSVVFQVFADGVKLYDSGVMTGLSATKSISIGVGGRNQLRLVVTDAGNGKAYDHADWANAKLHFAPPLVPPAYLSSLTPTSATNGWGPFENDRSNGEKGAHDGNPITLDGVVYPKGLGVHATSVLKYSLGGKFTQFSADVGIDDESGNAGRVAFKVYGDGVLLYDSGLVTGASATKQARVNILGRNELVLQVLDGGDGINDDHADWAAAQVS